MVGADVGASVGADVGATDGARVTGASVGAGVGAADGARVTGGGVGAGVGAADGDGTVAGVVGAGVGEGDPVPRKALVVLGAALVVASPCSSSPEELSTVQPDSCEAAARRAAQSPAAHGEGMSALGGRGRARVGRRRLSGWSLKVPLRAT